MKHLATEAVVEFVRGTLAGTQRAAIEQHLHSCAGCTKAVHVYRRVASAASREEFYSPPDDVVRIAKAYFATQAVASGGIAKRFELLFDSFANPAAAGARITGAAARQLLYRIGSVFVDMEMDNEFGSQRVALVGQILDSSKPTHPVAGVPITLISGERSLARTSSNQNGEFELEFKAKKELRLAVNLDRGEPVYLPITDAAPGTPRGNRKGKRNGRTARKPKKTG